MILSECRANGPLLRGNQTRLETYRSQLVAEVRNSDWRAEAQREEKMAVTRLGSIEESAQGDTLSAPQTFWQHMHVNRACIFITHHWPLLAEFCPTRRGASAPIVDSRVR